MRTLTHEQTMERYGLTLKEWQALTETQRAGRRSNYNKAKKTECDCGNPATVLRCGFKICQRCAALESERGQRFDGNGIGESVGRGYEPDYYRLHLRCA